MIIGVDIGGTHIVAGIVDLKICEILPGTSVRKEVDALSDAGSILDTFGNALKEVISKSSGSTIKIGISMPGPFDYENGISLIKEQGKYKYLYGLNIKETLSEKLSIREDDIIFKNDAASFLNGEVFCGSAQGYSNVIGLTLGTGLGSAYFLNEVSEDASLWDHSFKDGIAEDYLCTRWFVKRYKELSGIKLNGVKELVGYYESDGNARMVFEEFGKNLADFLIPEIKTKAPEAVVIGGNISNAWELFIKKMKSGLAANSIDLPLIKTTLGENASLIGAASSWMQS